MTREIGLMVCAFILGLCSASWFWLRKLRIEEILNRARLAVLRAEAEEHRDALLELRAQGEELSAAIRHHIGGKP